MRALVYVQHLLGIGHLARIRRIAASLVEAGVETVLVEGGTPTGLAPAAGVETIQLTPVRVAANAMSLLLHADGSPFTEADKAARRDQLLAIAARHQPDILLIEAFPFGRRAMRFELLPLLAAAGRQGAAVIASSVRDILQESGDLRRAEETVETLNRHFDLLLVHGDEALTPLSLTFPLADRITAPIRYTGTVGPRPAAGVQHGYAAIVSAGGGVVGETLLATAIAARGLSPLADAPWLVLTGPNLPDERLSPACRRRRRPPGRARDHRARRQGSRLVDGVGAGFDLAGRLQHGGRRAGERLRCRALSLRRGRRNRADHACEGACSGAPRRRGQRGGAGTGHARRRHLRRPCAPPRGTDPA